MKAQVIHQFGDPSVFMLVDVPKPVIKPGHVLIKVKATSVNPIDCKVRSGAVGAIAPAFPAVLHGDVAGIVEDVGEGVRQFKKGDEVFGCAGGFTDQSGALAEWMLADVHFITQKPKSLSFEQAAALPLVSITAWMALFDEAQLNKEKNILVHAGVGGVGHVAVQLAKWCGAKVYATVRTPQDLGLAKSLGADQVINTQTESVEHYKKRLTHDEGFQIIFDTIGGAHLNESFEAAAFNGRIVTTAARSNNDLSLMHNKGLSLHCVFMLLPLLNKKFMSPYSKILEQISKIVDEGKLKPLIDGHQYSLENISAAHQRAESGEAKGKVVVSV